MPDERINTYRGTLRTPTSLVVVPPIIVVVLGPGHRRHADGGASHRVDGEEAGPHALRACADAVPDADDARLVDGDTWGGELLLYLGALCIESREHIHMR